MNSRLVLTVAVIIFLIFSACLAQNSKNDNKLEIIKKTMFSIQDVSTPCKKIEKITTWQEGISLIKKYPREISYYCKTADLLAKDKDYESATTLIELGLDFIKQNPVPPELCKRLKKYYKHLKDRPTLDNNCNKLHIVK